MSKVKSILIDKSVVVTGTPGEAPCCPITLHVSAKELNYGPVIEVTITSDTPFDPSNREEWDDHPFKFVKNVENKVTVQEIIDDTPAVRALLQELVAPASKLYTTTDCTHKGSIIQALSLFWS